MNALREQGRLWLAEARQVAAEEGVRASLVSRKAPVVPVLAEEALNASLLVLGTRGLGGFTAVALAGRVHCPMVVVRGDEPADGPVVVGVDGTRASEAAVAFAFAEASRHGAELLAVHAWAEPARGDHEPRDVEPVRQRACETLGERLAGWQEKYPEVRVTSEVVRDHRSRTLLRYAEGARLVVVGTRGRGGFRGLLLGSTGQHLLYHAPCPVAVVRTEPDLLG